MRRSGHLVLGTDRGPGWELCSKNCPTWVHFDLKPEFLEKVKAHYNLETIQDVNDDHIRRFIHNVFSTAVDKGYAEVVS